MFVATSQVKTGIAGCVHQGRPRNASRPPARKKGCLSYESHTSINDPNLFVVVERWETREDLNGAWPARRI